MAAAASCDDDALGPGGGSDCGRSGAARGGGGTSRGARAGAGRCQGARCQVSSGAAGLRSVPPRGRVGRGVGERACGGGRRVGGRGAAVRRSEGLRK